jgi:tetratricopeptide (TPR) repeat protein
MRPVQPLSALSFDDLFAAYDAGDFTAASQHLRSADDFKRLGPSLRRGLAARPGGGWSNRRAGFVLEIDVAAAHYSPRDVLDILTAGRQALVARTSAQGTRDDPFPARWHQAALAILQSLVLPAEEVAYLDAIDPAAPKTGDASLFMPRLDLYRAVAAEQSCWRTEETEQPTTRLGALVDPTDHSTWAERCRSLVAGFDRATRVADTRTEALIRSAVALLRVGRYADGLAAVTGVRSGEADQVQQYWAALIEGRLLQALHRSGDAMAAYLRATELYPDAPTARIGWAIAALETDRRDEAVSTAEIVFRSPPTAGDPWWSYYGADGRFVTRWVEDLRRLE